MILIFGSRPRPGSWLIRALTFSRYSHVGIVFGDRVVEAAIWRVREIPLTQFKEEYPVWEIAELPCADEAVAKRYAYSRIGNLYDFGGLLAFPFQRDWQSNGRDFCSELPISAAADAGSVYVRDVHRVTPENLYQISRIPLDPQKE